MKFHINSSRVFILIIFYDAAQVKNKMNTILFHTWVCLWNISVFITTIIIVFAYFAQNNLPICPFLFLFVLCRSQCESLKCKYINTKLPCCCCSISHVQIGISGCILLPKELPSSRKLHKSQNFVWLRGLSKWKFIGAQILGNFRFMFVSFRFVSYPSRFFIFYFSPLSRSRASLAYRQLFVLVKEKRKKKNKPNVCDKQSQFLNKYSLY